MKTFKVNAYSGEQSLTKLLEISKCSPTSIIGTECWPGPLTLKVLEHKDIEPIRELIQKSGLKIIEEI